MRPAARITITAATLVLVLACAGEDTARTGAGAVETLDSIAKTPLPATVTHSRSDSEVWTDWFVGGEARGPRSDLESWFALATLGCEQTEDSVVALGPQALGKPEDWLAPTGVEWTVRRCSGPNDPTRTVAITVTGDPAWVRASAQSVD